MWEASLLSVKQVAVRYGTYIAVHGVSIAVAEREVVCLMGHNGSGKSSLMNAISGLVPPASGVVSLARALMGRPRVLMLDEPFLGLSPRLVGEISDTIRTINAQGVTVLFTEQSIQQSLRISDRGYILESGRLAMAGTSRDLLADERLARIYMGLERTEAVSLSGA